MAKSGHAGDERRGLIIINDAATEDQGFVFVHEHIARRIKKHQIDGIRFLWNQIVTSGDEEPMQGCLLAHTYVFKIPNFELLLIKIGWVWVRRCR
jgi:hypothetical protein